MCESVFGVDSDDEVVDDFVGCFFVVMGGLGLGKSMLFDVFECVGYVCL